MCTTRHFAISMDEKGNDGIDIDDEPEAPKNEKEVADRQAKLETMKAKVAGGETEKSMPQKTNGKEETYKIF